MPVNRDKPDRWKKDITLSVDLYNDWFLKFAPQAYRDTRIDTTKYVAETLRLTDNLRNVCIELLEANPSVLPTLRMSTCPPIAVDRLIGLSGAPPNLVGTMEKERKIPPRLKREQLVDGLKKIAGTITRMADPDIFVWLDRKEPPSDVEVHRAATIVADRLCGAVANPIIRNAQEKRQLEAIGSWLKKRGYRKIENGRRVVFSDMEPGTYSFRLNVPVQLGGEGKTVNIPVDAVVMPNTAKKGHLPLLIEAKSAGDFTNVNKRRKEEAVKMSQLRATYGKHVQFVLFLCGYFDSGYLGYEAAEGIDWVWEHRIDELAEFGV